MTKPVSRMATIGRGRSRRSPVWGADRHGEGHSRSAAMMTPDPSTTYRVSDARQREAMHPTNMLSQEIYKLSMASDSNSQRVILEWLRN